jgi:hypothetical protein
MIVTLGLIFLKNKNKFINSKKHGLKHTHKFQIFLGGKFVRLDKIKKMGDTRATRGWFFLGKFKRPSHHIMQPKNKNENLKSSHLDVKGHGGN